MDEFRIGLDGVRSELPHVDGPEIFLEKRLHPGNGDGHDVGGGAGAEIAAAGEELVSKAHAEFLVHEGVVGPVLHGSHHVGAFGAVAEVGGQAPHAAAAELVVRRMSVH